MVYITETTLDIHIIL